VARTAGSLGLRSAEVITWRRLRVLRVARTWLSIRVELVSGRGEDYWPRPGRIFAAARSHSFGQLAAAIDAAFARWDLAHLHLFTLADGGNLTALELWEGEEPECSLDSGSANLSRLALGDQFAYVFDLGDDWAHLCTLAAPATDGMITATSAAANNGSSFRCQHM